MNQSILLGSINSRLATRQSSIPWCGRHQEAEQQRHQLLDILLQHQQLQQQETLELQRLALLLLQSHGQQHCVQPFMAAAIASSSASSLPSTLANANSQILAMLGSMRSVSASPQLAKLTPQAMFYPIGSDHQERLAKTLLTGQAASVPRQAEDAKPTADYSDASKFPDPSSEDEDCAESEEDGSTSGLADNAGAKEKFPCKLYRMLDEVEKNGDGSVVSFFSHGRAFAVHKPRDFVSDLMPKYFNTTRIASFQRQLLLYGFRRITTGRDKGGYFHEYFLRGRKCLCRKIRRKKSAVQNQSDSSTVKSNAGVISNHGTAESENAVNQAILAQWDQQFLSQRVAQPTQHLTQESIELILGVSAPLRTRLGIPAAIVDSNKLFVASERIDLERRLLRQWIFAPRLQHQEGAAVKHAQSQEY